MTNVPAPSVEAPSGRKLFHCGTLTYTRPGLARLYFWLLAGDFTYFMTQAVVPSAIPLKFKSLHATNFLMAMVISTAPKIIGGIFNPVISFRSDRYRSRWGRRIPFIAATLPFLVLCFLGLALVDDIGPWLGRTFPSWGHAFSREMLILIVLSVVLIAFDFFNTFVTSVFWYLFNDVVPQELISRFTSYFRMVIMVTGIVYNDYCVPYV
jgi:maltose/moltooligosaccharide transporter